jgi:phosphoserine phosphatase RsbU/P
VRYTLRAEARHDGRPDRLLSVLNDAILTQRRDGRFCTLACARLSLNAPGEETLELSLAGHPPPLLLDAEGTVEIIQARGQLLGIFGNATFAAHRVPFRSGSTLVLYTDGLLDASAPALELTPDDLADDLAGEPPPLEPQSLVDRLYRRALGDDVLQARDDIAILAARLLS